MEDIKDNFDIKIIKQNIKDIQIYINSLKITDELQLEINVMDKFKDFQIKYPFLVKKICKKEDLSVLYTMLEKLDEVEQGKNTFLNVEKNLADSLAKEYLNINK